MNIIVLTPVKNEAWILPWTLAYFSNFADYIIIGDQNSTDGSKEIYKQFSKVKVIENKEIVHSNKIRWELLEEARKIEGENIIVCLDADEWMSGDLLTNKNKLATIEPGTGITLEWIQAEGDINHYRNDTVWKDNWKSFVFKDDRKVDYNRQYVINDHTERLPQLIKLVRRDEKVIHLQFLAKERTELKQAWYMCQELILQTNSPQKINHKYGSSISKHISTAEMLPEWIKELNIDTISFNESGDWYVKEITDLFTKYGITYFEALDIWHNKKLLSLFVSLESRQPKVKKYPILLVTLNTLKNKIVRLIKK